MGFRTNINTRSEQVYFFQMAGNALLLFFRTGMVATRHDSPSILHSEGMFGYGAVEKFAVFRTRSLSASSVMYSPAPRPSLQTGNMHHCKYGLWPGYAFSLTVMQFRCLAKKLLVDVQSRAAWGAYNGKIDGIEAAGSVSSSGVMGFSADHTAITKTRRPVTQVPGEEWAETDCFWFMLSCESTSYFNNKSEYQIRTPEVFTNNARIKAPWFFVLQQNYIFQLRGVYNIYPWITSGYSSTAESRNWLVKLDAFGEQFFAFSKDLNRADDYYSPMEVYIQLTGEW